MFLFHKDVPTEEGGYEFECQHGPEECEGNMMLACAKTYIPDQDTYVEFNICVMSADYPPTAGQAVSPFKALKKKNCVWYSKIVYFWRKKKKRLKKKTIACYHL